MVSPITLSSTEYILLAAMWPDSCRTSPHQPLPYRVRNMSSGGGSGSGVAVGSGIRVGLGVGVLLMTIVGATFVTVGVGVWVLPTVGVGVGSRWDLTSAGVGVFVGGAGFCVGVGSRGDSASAGVGVSVDGAGVGVIVAVSVGWASPWVIDWVCVGMGSGASVGVGSGLFWQLTAASASAPASTAMVGAAILARGITAMGYGWDRARGVVTIH